MKPRDAIRQKVVVSLQVSRRRANVHPVGSRRNMRKERLTLLKKFREQTILERIIFAFGNQVENLWFQNIGACINISTIRLARLGLFYETLDTAIFGSFDYPVHAGILDRDKKNRRRRLSLLVLTNNRFQIPIRQVRAVVTPAQFLYYILITLGLPPT